MNWININERLPENNTYVYMFGAGGRQFTALYKKNTFLAYNPFNEELEECEHVTHWMPLFEPPSRNG